MVRLKNCGSPNGTFTQKVPQLVGPRRIFEKPSTLYHHGNLRVPPQCHPPQEIRPY